LRDAFFCVHGSRLWRGSGRYLRNHMTKGFDTLEPVEDCGSETGWCSLICCSGSQAPSVSFFLSLFSRAASSTNDPTSVPPAGFCFPSPLPSLHPPHLPGSSTSTVVVSPSHSWRQLLPFDMIMRQSLFAAPFRQSAPTGVPS
jgi:hypothetical protein